MKPSHERETVDTTVGDLIAAVNDAAFEFSGDQRGAYLLASLALGEILKRAHLRTTDRAEISLEYLTQEVRFQ